MDYFVYIFLKGKQVLVHHQTCVLTLQISVYTLSVSSVNNFADLHTENILLSNPQFITENFQRQQQQNIYMLKCTYILNTST